MNYFIREKKIIQKSIKIEDMTFSRGEIVTNSTTSQK